MNIFTIYIGIIKPLFCFDCTNFKVSVIIKIINFNEILKNGLFNFIYQNFKLSHIYLIIVEKNHFLK